MNDAAIFSAWGHSVWYLLIAVLFLGLAAAGAWFYYHRQRLTGSGHLVQENILIAALMDVEESAVLANQHGFIVLVNPSAEKLFRQRVRSARG